MILVTELHGNSRYINADMIEFVESNPETQVVMASGRRVFVREKPEDIVQRIVEFRRRCGGDAARKLFRDPMNSGGGEQPEQA